MTAREVAERKAAIAAEKARAKAYDAYVLSGGANECISFGINDGCKPWCPVFERGQCEIQDENAAIFASEGATPMTDTTTNAIEALQYPERMKVIFTESGLVRLWTAGDVPDSLAGLPVAEYVNAAALAALTAERDGLREALEKIATYNKRHTTPQKDGRLIDTTHWHLQGLARAALNAKDAA